MFTEGRNHGITDLRNYGITEGQAESSIAPLFQSGAIKTMTGNNPKLDLVNVDARKKRLVIFCQFILKILSGNEILMSIKGRNYLKIYRKITATIPS